MLYEKNSPNFSNFQKTTELDCNQVRKLLHTSESVQKEMESFGLKGLSKRESKQIEDLKHLSYALDCDI